MKKINGLVLWLILITSFISGQQIKAQTSPGTDAQGRLKILQESKKQAERELADLLVKYTSEHMRVKEQKQKIADIDRQMVELAAQTKTSAPISAENAKLLLDINVLRTKLRYCGFDSSGEGCADGSVKKRLAESYQKAARSPEVLMILFGDALERFDSVREQTRSAMQVSQIADEQNAELFRLLVAQNQRIIELLEQLVKKK